MQGTSGVSGNALELLSILVRIKQADGKKPHQDSLVGLFN
jgi:hypothetical protein